MAYGQTFEDAMATLEALPPLDYTFGTSDAIQAHARATADAADALYFGTRREEGDGEFYYAVNTIYRLADGMRRLMERDVHPRQLAEMVYTVEQGLYGILYVRTHSGDGEADDATGG